MKAIPYILAAAVVLWAAYSLVKHFKNRKRKGGCGGCDGCSGCDGCGARKPDACKTCDRSKK